MDRVTVRLEIDDETWRAEVLFDQWKIGAQHDEAPAAISRDGEPIEGVKWARSHGWPNGKSREAALVEAGCLWAPGVVGVKPNTASALVLLTAAVQRAVVAVEQEAARRVA
jgi:hypothetical protein